MIVKSYDQLHNSHHIISIHKTLLGKTLNQYEAYRHIQLYFESFKHVKQLSQTSKLVYKTSDRLVPINTVRERLIKKYVLYISKIVQYKKITYY